MQMNIRCFGLFLLPMLAGCSWMKMPEVDTSALFPHTPPSPELATDQIGDVPEENPVPALREMLRGSRSTCYHAIQKIAALSETSPYPPEIDKAICDLWRLANSEDTEPFIRGNARWAAGLFSAPTETACAGTG